MTVSLRAPLFLSLRAPLFLSLRAKRGNLHTATMSASTEIATSLTLLAMTKGIVLPTCHPPTGDRRDLYFLSVQLKYGKFPSCAGTSVVIYKRHSAILIVFLSQHY